MTIEPVRWTNSGTPAEREMLALLGSERPSEELSARMRAVVVAPALAALGAVSTSGGAGAVGVGEAASTATVATNTTGAATAGGGLSAGAIALGALLVTGVVGLGWYFTSQSDAPSVPASKSASVLAPAREGAEASGVGDVSRETARPSTAPAAEQTPPPAAMEQPAAVPVVRGADSSGASAPAAGSQAAGSQAAGSQAAGSQAARGVVRPVAEERDASSLSRELAILEQARRALDRNDPRAAAGHLATYRAEYPDGQLKREASVLEQRARSPR